MKLYEYELPCYIMLPRKTKKDKRFSLNMNIYRNTHHMVLNQVKALFKPISGAEHSYKAKRIRIEYHLVIATKRKIDLMNVVSIADKFFADWLKNQGIIEDDNSEIIEGIIVKCSRLLNEKENRLFAVVRVIK